MQLRGDGMEQRRNGVGARGSKENACEESMGKLSEAGGGASGLVDEGLRCRAGCQHRFGRLEAMVAMTASMRWASAAAAGACTAVLAASGWACGWHSGFGLGGWVGAVGPDSASDSASVGRCRTHKLRGDQGLRQRRAQGATCGRSW